MQQKKSTINKINIVISLLIAFASWVYVVYNFVPMKSVEYFDVPVSIVGEENLEWQGLEVKKVGEKNIDVTLSIRRTDFTKIAAEDIEVKADVSNAVPGENGISLEIITPEGALLEESSTKSVSVQVGDIKH